MESIEKIAVKLNQKVENRLKFECLDQEDRSIITFGEDAFRFDFFVSVMETLDIPTHHIRLETPFPKECFVENKTHTEGRGRKSSKPKYDLEIVSRDGSTLAAVEFGLFKQTEIARVQDRSGRVGKLLNDFVRLSSLRLSPNHQKTSLYMVLLSDGEMMNYGKGQRGKQTKPVFQDYHLTAEYRNGLSKTTQNGIDSRFWNKLSVSTRQAEAKLIHDFSGKFGAQGQYKVAIWEIELRG